MKLFLTFSFLLLNIVCSSQILKMDLEQMARECLDSMDYVCAETNLKILVKLETNPSHRSIYLNNLGMVYQKMDNNKIALKVYKQGLKADYENFLIYNNRAGLRWEMEDEKGAFRDLERSLDLKPGNSALFIRGGFYVEKEEYEDAKSDFLAYYDSTGNISAMAAIAKTLQLEKDYHQSETLYRVLIQKYPNDVSLWVGLANLLILQNRNKEALDYSQKAVSINEDYPDTYVTLSRLYVLLKENEKACSYWEKAIELGFNGEKPSELDVVCGN